MNNLQISNSLFNQLQENGFLETSEMIILTDDLMKSVENEFFGSLSSKEI